MKFNLEILHVFFDLEFVPALAMQGMHQSCEAKGHFPFVFPLEIPAERQRKPHPEAAALGHSTSSKAEL